MLLLLDGHKSHVSVDLTEWALDHNIVIFILPAHTSHILQPMDVAVYGPLQKIYNCECHKFMRKTSATITRYNACELECKAYCKAFSSDNLHAAFRKTGICPLDITAIDQDKLVPAEIFQEQDEEETDSQATVEGGIDVTKKTPGSIFTEKEILLKKVKQERGKKAPRNTLSKLVSGQDLTDVTVMANMKTHELNNKISFSGSKSCVNKSKKSKLDSTDKALAQPGPSRPRRVDDTDSDDNSDDDLCCVCGKLTPSKMSKNRSIQFVDWAQCDNVRNGKPCMHWTHLKYCTSVRRVESHEKFLCPHCEVPEE